MNSTVLSMYRDMLPSRMEHTAIIFKDERVSYAQVEDLSEKVAYYLHSQGVGQGSLVGILIDRCQYMSILILAVLKTGAAYLPLDSNYPPARLLFMLKDSGANYMIVDDNLLHLIETTESRQEDKPQQDSAASEATDHFKQAIPALPMLKLSEITQLPAPPIPHWSQSLTEQGPEALFAVLYTSGSTGIPKGIKIPYRALNHYVQVYTELVGLDKNSVASSFASFSFDAHVIDLYPALCRGATLCIVPSEMRLNLPQVSQLFEANHVTHSFMTTQVGRQFALHFDSASLRYLAAGGEKLAPFQPDKHYTVLNVYGPTETLCTVCAFAVDKYYDNNPIGKPHPGTRFYILDDHMQPVPQGSWGELYLATPQMMLGYINRPVQEAHALVDNPFYKDGEPDYYKKLYRTGDKVRLGDDGNHIIGGRIDRQVQVRGFRIELGEVEECLSNYPQIESAAVKAWPNPDGSLYLAAYVTTRNGKPLDKNGLVGFIKFRKPAYMVPQTITQLEVMPVNANQKINYEVLPCPLEQGNAGPGTKTLAESQANQAEVQEEKAPNQTNEAAAATTVTASSSLTEQKLRRLLALALGRNDFSRSDNFWQLGLNSIGLIALLADVSQELNLNLTVSDLVSYPTLEKLTSFVDSQKEDSSTRRGPLQEGPYPLQDSYPLSSIQMGIYLDSILSPNSCGYNNPFLIKFPKGTELIRLRNAINKVVEAHPYLKTYIGLGPNLEAAPDKANGDNLEPRQFRNVSPTLPITVKETTQGEIKEGIDYTIRPFRFLAKDQEFSGTNFLTRLALIYNSENIYLFFDIHHAIIDGTSIELLLADLDRAYRGEELAGETYTAYDEALHERLTATLNEERHRQAQQYFDKLFADINGDMTLPGAAPGVSNIGGSLNKQLNFVTSKLNLSQIEAFCQRNGITPNAFFCGVFGYVLANFTGRESSAITSVYGGRRDSRLNKAMGMFTRTYPIAIYAGEDLSVTDFLQAMQKQITTNMTQDDCPFEELVHSLSLKNVPMLVYQGNRFDSFQFNGQSLAIKQLSQESNAALSLEIYNNPESVRFTATWADKLYDRSLINNLLDSYLTALLSFMQVEKLGQVELLGPVSLERWHKLNATERPFTYYPTIKRFEDSVAAHPDKTALICGNEKLTYGELNAKANYLANLLQQSLGYLRDIPLGIITDRSPYAYVARLAVMKAGGAFMCLGEGFPENRIESICRESQTPALLVSANVSEKFAALFSKLGIKIFELEKLLSGQEWKQAQNITNVTHRPHDLAYIIYTSGSTGTTKGVMIEEHSLSHLTCDMELNDQYHSYAGGSHVCSAWCALTFDVSVLEFIVPFCAGLTTRLMTQEEIQNPELLGRAMLDSHVDSMICVPSYLNNAWESPLLRQALNGLHNLNLGGEGFSVPLYRQLVKLNPNLSIFNCYGPSEATVCCSSNKILSADNPTLGRPMTNTKIIMLNRFQKPLPLGAVGELTIIGEGVGRGYFANPKLTAEKFITLFGLPAYRTGDLAWWNYYDEVQFIGRVDSQVKLNGLRIELDEIRIQLEHQPQISSAAVAIKNINGSDHICAYYTASKPVDVKALQVSLRQNLAPYMMPSTYTQLENLPLSTNGKTDLKALPVPELKDSARVYQAPQNDVERDFCQIFQDVLNVDTTVGATDSFFDLGGASLSVTKVVLAAERLGYPITYGDIFNNPTPQEIGNFLASKTEDTQIIRTPEDITHYDYTGINEILKGNTLEGWDPNSKRSLGNLLLTGATGFLGIHILRSYLENNKGHCYCLMRRGKQKNLKSRLQGLLVYYFSSDFSEYFDSGRITLIEGDVTNPADFDKLDDIHVDTLINCSANVRHFETNDLLDRVNVQGTRNAAAYCLKNRVRLIQISTSSVAGNSLDGVPMPLEPMTEHMLYFGQRMDNKYVLSKFRAERAVLENIQHGLDAKIMRVGNLMARNQDGEFQINLNANSFVNQLKAYHVIGNIAYEDLGSHVELSPIDFTAEAILLLSQTPRHCCVFHPFSNRAIYMYDLVKVMKQQGVNVVPCQRNQFLENFNLASQDDQNAENFSSLVAYRSIAHGHSITELKADNAYTMQALYRLGFNWPLVSNSYLNLFINSLVSLGFFDIF